MSTTSPPAATLTLPYLTEGIAPVPGAIKRRYEDFIVEEIPAYEACGSGDHVYFSIEKKGLATMRAVNDIARALNIPSRDIGLAGLKDARAVTVQMLSIEHIDPERIKALEIPRIRVLSVDRHKNKLKIGHLRGNRFRIKLRESDQGRVRDIEAVLKTMAERGVPNYFGQQRFGSRGDTWQMGQAMMRNDHKTLVDLMLGRPGPHDTGDVLRARHLYEMGKYQQAAKAWPYGFRDNARACRAMAASDGKHKKAFFAIDARLKKFFVSAYQSHLFNRYLAERLPMLDQVVEGDLAYKHDHGAVFRVTDAAAEAPRAAAFEISPTGPIFGVRMTRGEGEPGRIEQAILDAEQITCDDFRAIRGMKVHGARRPLRFRADDLQLSTGGDNHGAYVELCFTLAAGCYATMILREICKDTLQEGLAEETDDADTETGDDD